MRLLGQGRQAKSSLARYEEMAAGLSTPEKLDFEGRSDPARGPAWQQPGPWRPPASTRASTGAPSSGGALLHPAAQLASSGSSAPTAIGKSTLFKDHRGPGAARLAETSRSVRPSSSPTSTSPEPSTNSGRSSPDRLDYIQVGNVDALGAYVASLRLQRADRSRPAFSPAESATASTWP